MGKIPFMDLGAQIESLEPAITNALKEVLEQKSFIQGPAVERFNREFLALHGGRFGVGCSNGTSAITVALRALNVGPGDEVLVPNHTFFGTVEPIVEVGAKPVLVDIDEEYRQLDLKQAAKLVTAKTKGHRSLSTSTGCPSPMDQIMEFARAHKLSVIEDCAQAHLAKWKGKA
ncbi:MAG: aminotransferase class V-fold PLP-dependent enzyme, partial [Calothrix sp. SM1_5_4]|nr:aminotransferase class V-fold PLP-dependent enzyme [Calothrix sp. SM1_5_4]